MKTFWKKAAVSAYYFILLLLLSQLENKHSKSSSNISQFLSHILSLDLRDFVLK